ncbi:MAG TPA: 2-phospho-L-lactate guanylyltransferase [Gryllotalpicola sp.]
MSWLVVIPFKGAPDSKSRLAERFDDATRNALAVAFLQDTVSAARGIAGVAGVTIVSNQPGLGRLLSAPEGIAPARPVAPVEVIADPGDGLNAAITHGIASFRGAEPGGHIAALLGDLPALVPDELAAALALAEKHPMSFVPDAAGDGTTMITLAPGVAGQVLFGVGSAVAHAVAGYVPLDVPAASGLRRDVDSPVDLERLAAPGKHTRGVLQGLGG